MNIVITSESVWQLFLGLGGMGLVWMVLKWVGIRLGRWWNADSVKSQIEKVRAELKKHGREPKIVTSRSADGATVCVNLIPCAAAIQQRTVPHQETNPAANGIDNSWGWYRINESRLSTKLPLKLKLRLLKEYLGKVEVEAL